MLAHPGSTKGRLANYVFVMVFLYTEGMVASYSTSLFEFEVWGYALL